MKDSIDFCEYIADIEANPKAIAPPLTVRQFYALREHVNGCKTCSTRVDRVLASAPKQNRTDLVGEN